jgi:hypothetical protein
MRQNRGIEALLDSRGKMGELTVWVGGRQVIRKGFFKFPDKQDVLAAVQQSIVGKIPTPA